MLVLDGLVKHFLDPARGVVAAVDGVSASFAAGCCALVGGNGAGKSTLLRLVCGLLSPDAGRALLDGRDIHADTLALRRRLGYLPAGARLPPRLSGREMLAFAGGCHGLAAAALAERIAAMDAAFGLGELLERRIANLSTGQLQRLLLARTFLADPDLVVLDEPTTGLDLVGARAVVAAVEAARRPGRLILLSTHHMAEVERLADRVLVLAGGRLAADATPAGLAGGGRLEDAVHRLLADGVGP